MIKNELEQKIIITGLGLTLFLISGVNVFLSWNLIGGVWIASQLNSMLIVATITSLSCVLVCGGFILMLRSQSQLRSTIECTRTELEHNDLQAVAQQFFNLSLDLLAIGNFDSYFTHLNPAWEKTLGFQPNELKEQSFIAFIHADDVEVTQVEMKKLETGIPLVSFENRYRCKDGSYRWLSWTAMSSPEEGLFYGIAHDISEHKEVEAILQNTNAELEVRVAERTAALRQANDELVVEIVERRQVELALRKSATEVQKSQERFQWIAQVTNDVVWDWNLLTNEVWWNEGVQTIFGYSTSDVGIDVAWWYDHIHPEDRERVVSGIHSLIDSGESLWLCEYRYYRADGSVAHIFDRGCVIHDDMGRPIRMMGGMLDISDKKQAEQELQRREELFRQVLNTLPVGVWITDEQGVIVQGNPAGQRIWQGAKYVGINQYGEYIGWWADTGQRIAADEWALARAVTKGETSLNEIIKIQCFDGTRKTILNSAIPLLNEYQEIMGAIVVNQDITVLKQAEEALHESQHLIQKIADTTPTLLYIYDLIQKCNVYANRQFEEFFGLSKAEIKARSVEVFAEFLHPEDFQDFTEYRKQLATVKEGDVLEKEYRLKNSGGEWRWFDCREVVFSRTPEGLPKQILATAIDVTEHKQLEAELASSEERFRTCIENMLDCFGIYQAIRDESGEIVDFAIEYVNAAACVNNQMTKEEQIGRRLCELLPSHCASGLFKEYCQLVETDQPLLKESIYYEDTYKGQNIRRAFNICAVKLGDGFACAWRDVTERMQAEEALRDSEERLRTALEAANMGTWDWDILTGEMIWSDNFELSLGIATNSLKGNYESFIAKIHRDDRDRVLQTIERVLQKGGDYKDEFRVIFPNDTIRWLSSQGRVFYDETGKPVRMTGIDVDVTERKQAEEARRKTEELYRTMTNNFPNGAVMLFDNNLRYTLAAGKGLADVGLSKELMEGKTIWELFSPETCEILEPYYRAALKGNTNIFESPYNDRTYLVYVLPVKNEQGEIFAGMLMTQDITKRKRAEDALLEERNFVSAILDTANALIIVLDPEGRIVRFNRACEQITGYSFDEVKRQYFWDILLLSEEIESVKAVFQDLLCSQFPKEHENSWVAKDGSRRLLSWSNTVLLDTDGSVKYIIGIGIDITDRKRAEEMRRALEREQELSELRLRFFAMASHEFRTPLSTILLTAQLLDSSAQVWSPEKRRRNLQRIESAAKLMRQMLDDILTINRAETRKLDFNSIPLDVVKFCRYLLEEIKDCASPQHIFTFVSEIPDKLICIDEKIIRCILTHLLSNAIKYSPQGGEINLVLSEVGQEIQFQVRDQGIGIPLCDQPHLFEAFYRGENIDSISGSGLGLTVVKKCVELHRGRITFTSEVGVGTTFTVALPAS